MDSGLRSRADAFDPVAPHFGEFDHRAWLRAFPGRTMIGISGGAMARVAESGEITDLGSTSLVQLPGS